jgi:hypothetical protein
MADYIIDLNWSMKPSVIGMQGTSFRLKSVSIPIISPLFYEGCNAANTLQKLFRIQTVEYMNHLRSNAI